MISGGAIIGQYYPANSIVHSLDPRGKILISIMFMIVLFVGNNFYAFFGDRYLYFGLCASFKGPPRNAIKRS